MRHRSRYAARPWTMSKQSKTGFAVLLAVSTLGLLATTTVQASTVTVGSPLTASFTPREVPGPATVVNSALPESGVNVTSPITGTIVRWRLAAASGTAFRLRVLGVQGGSFYTGGLSSSPESYSGSGVQTFTTSLPIKAGETVGLDTASAADKIGGATVAGASFAYWAPPLPAGIGIPASGSESNAELAFNADVQPPPGITLVSPPKGSITGGKEVAIIGNDFTGVTAVRFGLVPALSFKVQSDSSILAVAPSQSKPGPVDVSVTTPAGITGALPSDRFTYTACVVPKLKHRDLKAAKEVLRKKECRPGKVTRRPGSGKSARVVRQGQRPKTILPPGAKVSIKLAS